MHTVLLIISIPFWLIGIHYILSAILGPIHPWLDVFVDGEKNPPGVRKKSFVFGLVLIFVAITGPLMFT